MTAHADFSPSATSRNILCQAAMQEGKKWPDKVSPYAEEGTLLHKAAEILFIGVGVPDKLDQEQGETVSSAVEQMRSVTNSLKGATIRTETVVTLDYNRPVFGTSDLIAYTEDTLLVADYKFGRGVLVTADANPQLMVYAKAAIDTLKLNPTKIILVVVQPRIIDKPSVWGLTAEELEDWCHETLYPAIEAAYAENPPYNPGKKQCQFCDANGRCPGQSKQYLDLLDGPEPDLKDPQSLSTLLERVAGIRDWCNAIEAVAMDNLEHGIPVPGFKLVRGKANRRWKDELEAEKFLKHRGIKLEDRVTMKVIGIPDAEKKLKGKLGTTRLQNSFAALIEKPEGKLTYAAEDDPRPAVNVAAATVAALPEETTLDELM